MLIPPLKACIRPLRQGFSSLRSTVSNYEGFVPAFKSAPVPCIAYWMNHVLYVALTNRSNTTPLHVTRGSGFHMPIDFQPLPPSYEPATMEILDRVDEELLQSEKIMARGSQPVAFAGWGEPTLRWKTSVELAENLKKMYPQVELRLVTNGLGNLVEQRDITDDIKALFSKVTVALNTADRVQYVELMQPDMRVRGEDFHGHPGSRAFPPDKTVAHDLVVEFIDGLVKKDVPVECTVVARPDVNLRQTQDLVTKLGGQYRERPYFP